jgi:hypothetical protein
MTVRRDKGCVSGRCFVGIWVCPCMVKFCAVATLNSVVAEKLNITHHIDNTGNTHEKDSSRREDGQDERDNPEVSKGKNG